MKIRFGIDVGGTFTKAVAVSASDGSLLQKVSVPTTHDAPKGVAEGVVQVFRDLLEQTGVPPGSIELVVLSTTQAVNALLEGDVATVGVVGIGDKSHIRQVKKLTQIGPVSVTPERNLAIHSEVLQEQELDDTTADAVVARLKMQGAEAIAVSGAYGVEDPTSESLVLDAARRAGIPATAGHEMSGLYGLEVRTFTAAINASILPKMTQVIDWVSKSIVECGVDAPLMVVNGTMGMVSAEEARRRPAATLLSGPAASVAGASLHHRMLDAFFMEVGGTSTNIGVLRNGRPVTKYVSIMDYPTCLRSMDVRVAGVAGGSMVRVSNGKIVDVGPRSAHIAGMAYACFAEPGELAGGELKFMSPRPGDPSEYAAIETSDGRRYAITLTDAANALREVPDGDNAAGSQESASRAFELLSHEVGASPATVAESILSLATKKLLPVLRRIEKEYNLRDPKLIGLGGAASVLVPRAAQAIGADFQIVRHAEVISSIGAAMTPVGIELERNLVSNSSEGLCHLINEARDRAVEYGASPDSVRIGIEPIPERSALRVRATGNVAQTDQSKPRRIDEAEARKGAAQALRMSPALLKLVFESRFFRVYQGKRSWGAGPIRWSKTRMVIVDYEGAVRFEARDPVWKTVHRQTVEQNGSLASVLDRSVAAESHHVVVLVGPHILNVPRRTIGIDAAVRELDRRANCEHILVVSGQAD